MKLMVAKLVINFPTFNGNVNFITAFTATEKFHFLESDDCPHRPLFYIFEIYFSLFSPYMPTSCKRLSTKICKLFSYLVKIVRLFITNLNKINDIEVLYKYFNPLKTDVHMDVECHFVTENANHIHCRDYMFFFKTMKSSILF
jgi:hypothetical protein